MKKTIQIVSFCLLAIMFAACQPQGWQVDGEHISWRTLEAGTREATSRNMPVLIDFFTRMECPRCQQLVKSVYTDQQLAEKVNSNFVPVRVNMTYPLNDEEKALMGTLGNDGECVLAFLDRKGQVLRDAEGKMIMSMEMLDLEKYNQQVDRAIEALH